MAEQCLCFRARWVARALTRLYDEALRPLDLQATQLTLLNAISVLGELDDDHWTPAERTGAGADRVASAAGADVDGAARTPGTPGTPGAADAASTPVASVAPGVPMSRLSDVLALDLTTLSRNLRPLERDGLVRIRRAPDDARVRLVSLTTEGARRVAEALPLWTQAQERITAALGPELAASLRFDFDAVMAADPLAAGRADETR